MRRAVVGDQASPQSAASQAQGVLIDPSRFDAVVFDLEGVLTDTAGVHASAWKRIFDAYFSDWARRHGPPLDPFDPVADYRAHVDGRSRPEAVSAVLSARGVELELGHPSDPPERESVWGLANRKRGAFLSAMAEHAATTPPATRELVRRLRQRGLRTAAVSPSRDAAEVMESAGIDELFTVKVDGHDAERLTRHATAGPDLYLEALARLPVAPARAVLCTSSRSGVEAGRAAEFGMIVAVDRERSSRRPPMAADFVVPDLSFMAVGSAAAWPAGRPGGSDRWVLEFDGEDPEDERRREVLCAVGNGYMVTRGSAPEAAAGPSSYPGTYLAGVFDRQTTTADGVRLEHEDLVNAPNWLPVRFRAEAGAWFGGAAWRVISHRQALDIRHGILSRETRAEDGEGRIVRIRQHRLVSMADPHLALLVTELAAENWSGRLELISGLDGDVANAGVTSHRPATQRHLEVCDRDSPVPGTLRLVAETLDSKIRIAVAARHRLRGGRSISRDVILAPGRIDERMLVELSSSDPLVLEKLVAVYTSRDPAVDECGRAAADALKSSPPRESLESAHRLAWQRLWARSEVWLDVGGRIPQIVDLHLFHLLQSVSPHTAGLDAGVLARGLHGEAYRGHVFWDELFVFPLLNFHFPELTRALLGYRHRRLGAARQMAAEAGFAGAMFPWQSGSTGREETPPRLFNPRSGRWMPDNSHRQRHVGLAIAYNVWHYYQVTGDLEFMATRGAELMIEIARFWASVATFDSDRDRYDISGVMGPDEFHDGPPEAPGAGLRNNAYTNIMAAWVLWRARQTVELLRGHGGSRLFERLNLRPEELQLWERVGRRLTVPFDSSGRISQFSGYEELEELDWEARRARYGDIGRLDLILEAEGDTPNRYKAAKQADVLMLFFMLTAEELEVVLGRLGYRFDPTTIPTTVAYYLARTTNGSTLSRVVHAWVLARSDRRGSWRLLEDALRSDVDDLQRGTTGEGIHLGAMAGTVDLLQRCYVDLDARDDTLHVNPRLPDELPRLVFSIDYRGQRLELDVTHEQVSIRARPATAAPVRVAVRKQLFQIGGGDVLRAHLGSR